jgi:DNA end-binding protein Ku
MHVWKNAVLDMGFSIDVGINPATSKDNWFSFRTLHSECNTPVKQQYVCPTDGQIMEKGETVRGIEYPKGSFIPVSDEEFLATVPKVRNEILVEKLMHEDRINPLLLDEPYWLIPRQGKERHYAALTTVLLLNHWVGLGRVAYSDKEHSCCITGVEGGMIMWTLKQPSQLRDPDWTLPELDEKVLARTAVLLEMMVDELADEDFVLPTTALKQGLLDAKTAGAVLEAVEQQDALAIALPDVMKSIEESIAKVTARKKARKVRT